MTQSAVQRDTVYFISDIHLGAGYIADQASHERKIADWLDSIRPHARELYILGDALDYWYEYRTVVPRGFVRFFGALARLADSGTRITWLKGNHDIWIFDYLPEEIGLEAIDGVADRIIDGKRFVMEHGDGAGEPRPSYRRMQKIFRNRFCQRLFAAIHPRWTVEFAHRWSSSSRMKGVLPPPRLYDDDRLVIFAKDYMARLGHVDYFIFGHRHTPLTHSIAPHTTLMILGESFTRISYATFRGGILELKSIDF
ncbi:MAG: UDP-2,3-diacylglucosamine diphosphatase [Bacteroides sp.]|nr:UDP-2,3-diacylglucosamine diphosphatase [Bacteroides sp.]MBD5375436.1 UDP-2,3-diacylglucosamine diphosphatase [Bacteroides sp.]MBD5375733.1 UDP-2,3-diacylglucosamine diphosphatase [Bacteroides sp.]